MVLEVGQECLASEELRDGLVRWVPLELKVYVESLDSLDPRDRKALLDRKD